MQVIKFTDIHGNEARFQKIGDRICSLTSNGLSFVGNNQSASEGFALWCNLKGIDSESPDVVSGFCKEFGLKAGDLN